MFLFNKPTDLPAPDKALPGRDEPILRPSPHHVNGRPITGPYPDGLQVAEFAMGCFWGAEKGFWQLPGVWVTAVGYQGGFTPNATYRETCTGKTGHAEAVRVVFDAAKVRYEELLAHFWESHDPTQGMRQGNDVGTQYRSAIFPVDAAQRASATASRDAYQERLTAAGFGRITTEIIGPPAPAFYFAEGEHQQYLSKNPFGYCPDHGTGVSCPVGVGVATGMGTEA
ncbi:MAG: peptide-methionine (S)-S-oxide reductase MsrA [Chloroflexi bacterium]|nr:peptide-methionine (S)-S-oxide reductase MsrA [Chloroflexota bacterium]